MSERAKREYVCESVCGSMFVCVRINVCLGICMCADDVRCVFSMRASDVLACTRVYV